VDLILFHECLLSCSDDAEFLSPCADEISVITDGLKHNLVSVSQTCDRGCEVLFMFKDYTIKFVNSRQVVAKGIRIENNVYVLKENRE
jgi:hypothetical protein